jgi:hypothetical protein
MTSTRLEAKRMPSESSKPAVTTASVNAWLKSVLADPDRATLLKNDWRALLTSELEATSDRAKNVAAIPSKDSKELQEAIAMVVDEGGTQDDHSEGPFVRRDISQHVQRSLSKLEMRLGAGKMKRPVF